MSDGITFGIAEIASEFAPPMKVAYRIYDDWRVNRVLEKAERAEVNLTVLKNSHHKLALFMRVQNAIEICSSKEVVDYLADAMIGGIKTGDIEKRPDFAQMAISSLVGVTEIELKIILKMREKNIYQLDSYKVEDGEELKAAYQDICSDLKLDSRMLNAIVAGLSRTGLVTPPASGFGAVIANDTCRLTPLAKELFHYVDYARRLT